MAQKTNLNISPYYDDFDADKEFYKVLFNPGKPIQARELTTLQSILQNQIESFGSNIFKEGSMIIPGGITYDSQFYAVKLNSTNYGVDISLYLEELVGKKITGQISGVTATVQYVQLPNGDEVEYPTIYVKYLDSDSNNSISTFNDGESLSATTDIVYGNTTITNSTSFATLITNNASSTGSAVSISDGVYFIRGYFTKVNKETIILDYYTNTPSYRVGLQVDEQIVTAKDDDSLSDNAKGFTNYAAPGADRFKISLSLTKKLLTDNANDTNFVELLRVGDGKINKIVTKTQYNIIRDYLAQRTYDESGDYVVDPFTFSLNNSLNDGLGNNGLFFSNEKTSEGNTPSDDLMCVKFSPGKAYVRGYDIEKTGTTIIDVEKPRDTETVTTANIPFLMGNLIRVNNVSGAPKIKGTIDLYDQRKNSISSPNGTKIGDARVYTFSVTDASYSSAATNWDLYLYDIQTYTQLILNQSATTAELPATSFIKGKSSGASGYAVSAAGGSSTINLRQTSGSFIVGEQLIINGLDTNSRTISSVKVYSAKDIKSVYQASDSPAGFPSAFLADTQLDKSIPGGLSALDMLAVASDGTATAGGKFFTGITTNSIIRYQRAGFSTETYNRVASISATGTSMTLAGITSVSGICDGAIGITTGVPFSIGIAKIRKDKDGSLFAPLPNSNISSLNLNDSNLVVSQQITAESTDGSGVMTFNISQITGITSAFFQPFDAERYSIHYSNSGIATLTSDQFSLSGNTATISGLTASQSNIVVNTTVIKNGLQSKVKTYNRSKTLDITLSKYPQSGTGISSSINDKLSYNQFYGLRVQDEEICLKYPDVSKIIAIYESLDADTPVLDKISLSPTANVTTNAIIGENIIGNTSKAIARVVSSEPPNTLGIVYLNENRFSQFELVTFEESNIITEIQSIISGKYKNITNDFTLDKGQKEQYYDYSKIVRNSSGREPAKCLLVIFDYYSVLSSDNGDVFTVLSYDKERYQNDIPLIGPNKVRATDTLDFRPRVSVFSSTTSSPFDFPSRTTGFGSDPKLVLSPNESCLVGYDYYLGRIDRVYLDKFGNLSLIKGTSSTNPKEPTKISEVMDIATITLPPYLYYPEDAQINIFDNKRYTMRDIGGIDNRVGNLEKITSLSLLEISTQTLQVQDASGLNRFKTGFFVDDFKNTSLIDFNFSSIQVDEEAQELIPIISKNTLASQIAPAQSYTDETLQLKGNFALLDSNVQKTGDQITLKYNEVGWIEQPLATQVENVNPFHVISYSGTIQLSPTSDNWIRTIRLEDKLIDLGTRTSGSGRYLRSATTYTSKDILVSSTSELYMRSRNTLFSAVNLKPLTNYYQFFDGNSAVDFIPKLVEIASDSTLQTYGASSAFQVGETVIGYIQLGSTFTKQLIEFRVASANHKYGPFNAPTKTYNINPYIREENLSASYSSSSKVLNIDVYSLSEEAQGKYSGYLTKGMQLVGQTSGAVAYVKDLRLISDNYGDLIGSFFLRDPNTNPPPVVRIGTGTKTYRLSSSSTNALPLPGSKLISAGETTYRSTGVLEVKQLNTTKLTTDYYYDPLAQTFTVGGNPGQAPYATGSSEDNYGCFLTSVDLFFANKDPGTCPVNVEIRTVEFGTPTRIVLGKTKLLTPDQVNIPTDIIRGADKKVVSLTPVATKVTFDEPIFLEGGQQYAVVILAPQSNEYELLIAEMDKNTVNTKSLPNAEAVRYTQQFAVGRLYKSQNGSEWTPNDYQDLMFKLYKAEFSTTKPGTATFYNPTLDRSNGYVQNLDNNPITTFARNYTLGITTTTNSTLIGILTTGRKVGEGTKTYNYGYVVGTGSSVASVGITTSGSGYTTQSNVSTYAITGSGSGLTLNITANTNGTISGITAVNRGNGYAAGDVVGIVTSSAANTGRDARITISAITGLDTLYLSGVQGQEFNIGASLVYYDNSGSRQTLTTSITRRSSPTNQYDGKYARISHFDHGMYAANNKVTISNVLSSTSPVSLISPLTSSSASISIAVGDTSSFATFEGASVSSNNPGYVLIEKEIIKYTSVGSGTLGASPGTLTRGQDSTVTIDHPIGSPVYKYELNGVSLRRINTTHDISDVDIDIDGYYIEIDRSSTNGNANRSSDDVGGNGLPQLSFTNTSTIGESSVYATENIQYDAIKPVYNIMTPGVFTSASAYVRTTSGTSVDGTEVSFQDVGFESVELNKLNKLSSTRIVCSKVNESTYLSNLPRNKSFTTGIVLNTTNKNLSPVIYSDTAFTEFHSNRLNQPVSDYLNDNRINSFTQDPNAAVYVSNRVILAQPASSLKVIFSAYRHSSADIRVLYSLIKPDSSEISQSFELFPGYDNLTVDTNQDGYLDIINPYKNSGKPDVFVPASNDNEFLEYQFTHYPAYDLDLFSGYQIKIIMSGTDQAHSPRIKELRTIAIR
jgi:hypothetical protein